MRSGLPLGVGGRPVHATINPRSRAADVTASAFAVVVKRQPSQLTHAPRAETSRAGGDSRTAGAEASTPTAASFSDEAARPA